MNILIFVVGWYVGGRVARQAFDADADSLTFTPAGLAGGLVGGLLAVSVLGR